MNKNDEHFMRLAIIEAQLAEKKDEVPVGCVIVINNAIVAKGHNIKEKTQLITRHAEIVAIEKLNKKTKSWRLERATLYVTLEPCIMCASAIMQSRVERVVFGAFDPKGGAFGSVVNLLELKGLNHYPTITGGVLEDENSELLKKFFKNKRFMKNRSAKKQ